MNCCQTKMYNEEVNQIALTIYQNTVLIGRPGSGKTLLMLNIIKSGIVNKNVKTIWISGSPQNEDKFRDSVYLFKRVFTVKELDNLLQNLEMQIVDEKCKFCIVFDDLQMLLPSSKHYCSFLANGRHFNAFCITLFQSIQFYTKNWKTILDNTFNYIVFNCGHYNRTVARVLCSSQSQNNIENSWKMKAYRKAINIKYGYIFYSNDNELLCTNIVNTYIILFSEWKVLPNHLKEKLAIKANNSTAIILSLDEVKRLLHQKKLQSIYDLIGITDRVFTVDENKQSQDNDWSENSTESQRIRKDDERCTERDSV